jgi:hypothetical protein
MTSSSCSPVVFDQRQQAVVLGPAGDACGEVAGDAREARSGVQPVGLGLHVAIEDRARRPAAGIPLAGVEDRLERAIAL